MKPAPPEVPAWAVKAEARISDNYNCDPVADTARSYLDTHDIARLIWEEYQEHAREACPPPAAARDGVDSAYEAVGQRNDATDGRTSYIWWRTPMTIPEGTTLYIKRAAMEGTP